MNNYFPNVTIPTAVTSLLLAPVLCNLYRAKKKKVVYKESCAHEANHYPFFVGGHACSSKPSMSGGSLTAS